MTDTFVEQFLAEFDDSCYPEEFLQKYELIECLAHNEMGETLLVKNWQTGEHYIAKCYSEQSLLSHSTENEVLKNLHHEGVPSFVGEHHNENMLCVVREYAQGTPLDKLVQETPLPKQQAISIAVQLCDILKYLHRQTPAVIHRDIKPQNIIVDENGKITLIDFGISRVFDGSAHEDTVNFGTKYFAAPEQYGYAQTDCRSDIFSLGVLLCWMLTGKVEVGQAQRTVMDHRLKTIVKKCTAFAPEGRYKNASQVRDALTGRMLRSWILVSFCALVMIATILSYGKSSILTNLRLNGISFREPLIEEAVRLSVGKEAGEKLTEADMLSVSELLIYGNKAAKNAESFNEYGDSFVNKDGTIQQGDITTLDDLKKLPNLLNISLVYQNISDLTPLTELTGLEYIDLRHNPIEDVTPLSNLVLLSNLSLFGTEVSDLTALHGCSRLTALDIGSTQVESIVALDGLDSLHVLAIRKAPLRSLDHIETHPMLEKIYLSETQLQDLTPLLELPRLELVEVSENMRSAADAITARARFSIILQ
jgi:serine/threonine protein kinase